MKLPFYFAAILYLLSATAVRAEEHAGLLLLREKYVEQLKAIQNRLRGKYSVEFIELVDKFEGGGNTDEANAVKAAMGFVGLGDPIPVDSLKEADSQAVATAYNTDLENQVMDLNTKYMEVLETEKFRLQNVGDFTGAVAMKRERDDVEKALESGIIVVAKPDVPEPVKPEILVLPAEEASTVGEVEHLDRWNALINWHGEESGATWSLESLEAGTYMVQISRSGTAQGQITLQQGANTLECLVPSTGSWDQYTDLEVGKITISDPSATLQLKVKEDHGAPFGFMNLRAITLTRVVDEG